MCIMNFPVQPLPPQVLPSSVLCSLTTESLRTASWNLKTICPPPKPNRKYKWVSAPRLLVCKWTGILAKGGCSCGILKIAERGGEGKPGGKTPYSFAPGTGRSSVISVYDTSRELGKHSLWNRNKCPINIQLEALLNAKGWDAISDDSCFS